MITVDQLKRIVKIYKHRKKGKFAPEISEIDKTSLSNRITENNKNVGTDLKTEDYHKRINLLEKDCIS